MKVVVIGGSAAGMSFAAKYKRNQPSDEVIVLDKRSYISLEPVAYLTLQAACLMIPNE